MIAFLEQEYKMNEGLTIPIIAYTFQFFKLILLRCTFKIRRQRKLKSFTDSTEKDIMLIQG